jgi:hypothetical protein
MKLSKFIYNFYRFFCSASSLRVETVVYLCNQKLIKRSKFWLVISFSLISLTTFSQGSETGCLLLNNRVYTNKGLLGTYFNNASTGLSTNYCSWTPTTGPTCYVCNGGLNILGACLSGTTSGVEGTFTMVACPLDDYLPILTLLAAGTGAYYIYRKKIYVKA